jgi:hypothetical protein
MFPFAEFLHPVDAFAFGIGRGGETAGELAGDVRVDAKGLIDGWRLVGNK